MHEVEVEANLMCVQILRSLRGSVDVTFPWKSIWCANYKAPKMIVFSMWTTTYENILAGDNLIMKGITLVSDAVCVGAKARP